jgi:hypothetical protein
VSHTDTYEADLQEELVDLVQPSPEEGESHLVEEGTSVPVSADMVENEDFPTEQVDSNPPAAARSGEVAPPAEDYGLPSEEPGELEHSPASDLSENHPLTEDLPPQAEPRAMEVHATPATQPEAYVRPGLFGRLFGSGKRNTDDRGLLRYEQQPGLLRVFARRSYQREAALASIRSGFSDLSDLMRDIRDGLHASVDKQGELLEHLKYLPVVAEQNQQSAQRFEEQSLAQTRLQMETIRTIRDQIRGQQEHQEQINRVLGTVGREARDQKRDLDEMEQRLERMRASDESIANNLSSVSAAVRKVSEHGSAQSELVLRMQESMDARTRQLEEIVRRQSSRQGWAMAIAMILALAALGAVATVGFLYLRQTGAI